MQVWTRLHSFLESRTSSNTLGCWKNSLPSNCRIEVPIFYCQLGFLVPRGSQFLVVWLGPRPSLAKWQFTLFFFFFFFYKPREESLAPEFLLIMRMASHHLCHILLAISKLQALPMLKGKNNIRI